MSGSRNSNSGLGIVFVFILAGLAINFFKEYWPYIVGGVVILFLIIVISAKNSSKKPILYIGNKSSKTYHKKTCQTLSSFGEGNMIGFHSEEEARRAGYRPCNICKP